jgi:hypothetical protein
MAYESIKIREVVDRSVSHVWSIPEFQRGFVWKPTQVRDLAESLWLDYPIGSLLVWNSQDPTEEKIARDAQRPTLWVGPAINIRISAQDPMNYIGRYNITAEKLEQQFINPAILTTGVNGYETWLLQRAEKLAAAGNAFLAELGSGL